MTRKITRELHESRQIEDQENRRQAEFARQLATLNAHPERWAILEQFYMAAIMKEESEPPNELSTGLALYVYQVLGRMYLALEEFGFDGITLDSASELLAARERQATE